jgi:tetratricopeptide (TPR) repeat protein
LEAWEARKLDSVEAAILRARLLAWIGAFSSRMGQGSDADAAFREALRVLRGFGDHPAAREALAFVNIQAARGLVNLAEDEEDQMVQFSLEYYRARDDAWGMAAVLPLVAGEGDLDRYRRTVLESIRMLRAIGDHQETAYQLNLLAEATHTGGYFAEAREYFKESIGLSRMLGDRYNVSLGLDRAGWVARQMGDYATARREHEESLALSRDIGDQLGIAGSLDNLGLVAFEQGDMTEAGRLFREALALRRAASHADSIVVSLEHLARLHIQRGELAEAETLLDECLTLAADWPQVPYRLGELRLAQGRFEEAGLLYQRALGVSYDHSFLWLAIEVAASLAELYMHLGNAPHAVETLACLLGHYACNHFTQRRARRLLETLTKSLTPHAYAEAEARGRALALGEVVKQAEA